MARTRDQVLASARAFMADCKPLQYDCEPGVFVNGRRRHLDQDDDPEDGRDYPSAEGSQQYATERAKVGLPVRMKLNKIRSLPGQSYLPASELRWASEYAPVVDPVGFKGKPYPRTLQEQKDLVKLVAKGGLKDVYPSSGRPISTAGFGETPDFSFDPPAMAVAADRLQERGHTLAAKIARWRASVEDPENFGHLWTKEHAEEHAAGYAASGDAIAGGVADNRDADEFDREDVAEGSREEMEHTRDPGIAQEIARDHLAEDPEYYRKLRKAGLTEYATERAKAGLPVRMELGKIRGLPGQSWLPVLDLWLSASAAGYAGNKGRGFSGSRPIPRTLQEQKDLVKLVAKGGLKDVYPSSGRPISTAGFGETPDLSFDPPAMAVAADRLADRGHTLAAKLARWRASIEDPENFGHLWTKEHRDEHAAGYAAKPGGVQSYATERAKAGLPVKMNLMHINNIPGQSHIPAIDLSLSASAAGYAGNKGSGFSGSRPVPRTLQEQKDLVKLVAKGGLKDVYPAGDNPVSEVGFGEMRRGIMHTFDPSAIAVAADRLQDRGHMLAAKIARWRAATEDPKNFGHLWTKEHEMEHVAGYASKPGGVQSYATERAKAGLPVRMNLKKVGNIPGQSYLPAMDLRLSASAPGSPENKGSVFSVDRPTARTLKEQKDLVKLIAKGGLKDVYPSGKDPMLDIGFGEKIKKSLSRFDPPSMAIASDRLEERGHTLAARVARWRAATEDPKNFGHLWTKEHAAEHAAGYAAKSGGVQQYGLRDSLKKAARVAAAGAAIAGGGTAGMNAGTAVLPALTMVGNPVAATVGNKAGTAGEGREGVARLLPEATRSLFREGVTRLLPEPTKSLFREATAPTLRMQELERKLGGVAEEKGVKGYAASMSENQRDGMSVQYAADLVCGM